MNRVRVLVGIALILVIAIGTYLWLQSDSDAETAVIERGSIDVTIDTVGTIQVRDPQPLRAEVAGTVAALGAEPGDVVEGGDIVVLLDTNELDAIIESTQRALEAAEFELQFAEQQLDEDADSAQRRAAVVQAHADVEQAREAVREAESDRSSAAIVAKHSGIVLELLVVPGDRIGEDQPVARLYNPGDLALIADVDELDLPNVRPGADVRFRLDSFPATEIEGSIVSTAPEAIQRGGATLFPAEVDFSVPDGLDVRPGMNAEVTIVSDLREGVLLAPERALRTVGRRVFVDVQRDSSFEEVEVILGYRAAGVAEVVEGLEEGDRVRLR